jgi:acetyltransferase-like isoleucine patch superfamily enzyme
MVASGKSIKPFGEHPRDCLITNRKLGEMQEEVLKELGLELEVVSEAKLVEDPGEHILFVDSLYFSKELLQEFIAKSREVRECTICALKPGIATLRSITATQDVKIYDDRVEYGISYMPPQGFRKEPVPLVFNVDRFYQDIPMPEHFMGAPSYRMPVTDRILIQVDHWVNLWSANIATLLSGGDKLRRASKLQLLALAFKARSFNQWKVLNSLNEIGRHCDIHPTAYVEGSTIGDGVKVGAGSVIRESVVGDGTYIANNVTIEAGVVGEKSFVGNKSVIQYAVLYPGTFFTDAMISAGVTGRESFVGGGVTLSDFRLDGKHVTVMKDGILVSTENSIIGSCLGHGVYLSAGCIVAPGRAIPNGLRLAPEGHPVIRKCNADGDGPGFQRIEVVLPDT